MFTIEVRGVRRLKEVDLVVLHCQKVIRASNSKCYQLY